MTATMNQKPTNLFDNRTESSFTNCTVNVHVCPLHKQVKVFEIAPIEVQGLSMI